MAFDKNGNEKEECSKLLQVCTQEFNFANPDYGYAFDHMIWVRQLYISLSQILEPQAVRDRCASVLEIHELLHCQRNL